MAPIGRLTEADAAEIFTEQAKGLKEGGADILWVETVSSIEDMRAAIAASDAVRSKEQAKCKWCNGGGRICIAPSIWVKCDECKSPKGGKS